MTKYDPVFINRLVSDVCEVRRVDPTEVVDELINTCVQAFYSEEGAWNMDIQHLDLRKGGEESPTEFPFIEMIGGSSARVVALNLSNYDESQPETILVGKGVTYDSGGYSIKSTMDDMFYDKMGAVLTFIYAVATGTPALCFFAHNLIHSGDDEQRRQYVPGSIVEAHDRKVYIQDTDAEGRLGLADLISYVRYNYPKSIPLTVATLTGAAHSFSGPGNFALVHGLTADKAVKVVKGYCDEEVDLWPAPFNDTYRREMMRTFDTMYNYNPNYKHAGSQTAYMFLRFFNDRVIHLDIAAMMDPVGIDKRVKPWGAEELSFLISLL